MPSPLHPDDELLASLAGDEPEAATDSGLVSHVAACDRCGPMVRELRQLRTALAALPDVPPSRPLQLLPPVPAAAPSPGRLAGFLRRLTAPAMAAAAALILVGAVGTAMSGSGGSAGAALSGGPRDAARASAGQPGIEVPGPSDNAYGISTTPVPRTADSARLGQAAPTPLNPYPWLVGIGVGLLAAAFLARGYVKRREGEPGL